MVLGDVEVIVVVRVTCVASGVIVEVFEVVDGIVVVILVVGLTVVDEGTNVVIEVDVRIVAMGVVVGCCGATPD